MQTASNGHTAIQRPVVHAPAPARPPRGPSAVSSWPFITAFQTAQNPQQSLPSAVQPKSPACVSPSAASALPGNWQTAFEALALPALSSSLASDTPSVPTSPTVVDSQKELSKSSTLFRRLRRTSLIASATATASAVQATTPSIASFSSNSVISFPSESFFALLVLFAFIVFALQLLALVLYSFWLRPCITGAATQSGKRSAARLGGEAQASAAPHGNHGDNKPSRSATE